MDKDYAIIRDGGKQYVVSVGDVVLLDRRKAPVPEEIVISDVLALRQGEEFKAGKAASATVVAEVKGEALGPKTVAYMFKRRKGSRTKKGHRQKYLKDEIKEIRNSG